MTSGSVAVENYCNSEDSTSKNKEELLVQREDIFDTTTLDSGDTSTEESSSEEKQQQQQLKQQQNSTSDVAPHLSDEEKLRLAKAHLRDDQILAAARLVRCLKDKEAVTTVADDDNSDNNSNEAFLEEVERKAALIEGVIADLNTDPGDKWIKMGESHNSKRDTIMYYQLTKDLQLKCRLETPIESSLLVPLLSVLNETDLFTTWMPSWNYPRLGLDKVEKLAQMGRTEQTIQFISRVPWPFPARDVIMQTLACDDIDDIEGPTTGTIAIGLCSLEEGDQVCKSTVAQDHYKDVDDVMVVPPCPEGMKRAEFEGGLLIRNCPEDHATLQGSTIQYPSEEDLILVGFSMRIDGKISPKFPTTIINFVIRTVISAMWQKFLDLAEEIRAGNRPQHAEAIAQKRGEIYDWVDKRIEDMFAQLNAD